MQTLDELIRQNAVPLDENWAAIPLAISGACVKFVVCSQEILAPEALYAGFTTANIIHERWHQHQHIITIQHPAFPESVPQQEFVFDLDDNYVEHKFNDLVKKWKQETGDQSSLSRITSNRHYLEVVTFLGESAIPHILKRLQATSEPWFFALRAITQEYQIGVGPEYTGNFRKMADAWLEWGKKHEHI